MISCMNCVVDIGGRLTSHTHTNNDHRRFVGHDEYLYANPSNLWLVLNIMSWNKAKIEVIVRFHAKICLRCAKLADSLRVSAFRLLRNGSHPKAAS